MFPPQGCDDDASLALSSLPPELLAYLSSFLSPSDLLSFLLLEQRCYASCRHLLTRRREKSPFGKLEKFEQNLAFRFFYGKGRSNYYLDFALYRTTDFPSCAVHYPQRSIASLDVQLFLAPLRLEGGSEVEGVDATPYIVTEEEAKSLASLHRHNLFCLRPSQILLLTPKKGAEGLFAAMQLPEQLRQEEGYLYTDRAFVLWWTLYFFLSGEIKVEGESVIVESPPHYKAFDYDNVDRSLFFSEEVSGGGRLIRTLFHPTRRDEWRRLYHVKPVEETTSSGLVELLQREERVLRFFLLHYGGEKVLRRIELLFLRDLWRLFPSMDIFTRDINPSFMSTRHSWTPESIECLETTLPPLTI